MAMRGLLAVLLAGMLLPSLWGQVSDSVVAKARTATGSPVIRCSPDGRDGTVLPLEALRQLKRGAELVLLPGAYEMGRLEIFPDRVVIRGEGGGKSFVNIAVSGKDCIVRDLNVEELHLSGGSATIVDCIVRGVTVTGEESRRKVRHAIHNTGLRRLHCLAPSARVDMRNCTLVGEGMGPAMDGFGQGGEGMVIREGASPVSCSMDAELNIEESVLHAPGVLFYFRVYLRRQPKLALKNNVLHGKSGLGQVYAYASSDRNPRIAFDLKMFRRQAAISLQGENLVEEPRFMPPSTPEPGRWGMLRADDLQPVQFLLAPESPGTGRGIIAAEHPFLKGVAEVSPAGAVVLPPDPPPMPPPGPPPPPGGDRGDDHDDDSGLGEILIPPPPPVD